MAPELVPLAVPVPLPSWFEWAKLIVPPIITGLVVLTGAYLTYRFANRGRKEEILYKERYKGFEEISGYLYSIQDLSSHQEDRFSRAVSTYETIIPTELFFIYCSDLEKDISSVREKKPNDKYLTLQDVSIVSEYYHIVYELITLQELLVQIRYLNRQSIDSYSSIRHGYFIDILDHLQSIHSNTIDTIEAALNQLDLPKR